MLNSALLKDGALISTESDIIEFKDRITLY
jgi:hypothetical protein